jgi:hypothetical protein
VRSHLSIALLLSASSTLMACGTTSSDSFGVASHISGQVAMTNPDPDRLISGLTFDNEGTSDITIAQLRVTLADGSVSDTPFGFGVQAHDSTSVVLVVDNDEAQLERVASISFVVEGSTEQLVVSDSQTTGTVPTPAP